MKVATESYAATAAGVRAAIAAYAQAVDDGRRGDIAALSCEDGWVDLPSAGVVVGRKALDALFRGEKAAVRVPPHRDQHPHHPVERRPADGAFSRGPCVSSMTPERQAPPPTAASNHRKAP